MSEARRCPAEGSARANWNSLEGKSNGIIRCRADRADGTIAHIWIADMRANLGIAFFNVEDDGVARFEVQSYENAKFLLEY